MAEKITRSYGVRDLKELFPSVRSAEENVTVVLMDKVADRIVKTLEREPAVFGATDYRRRGWMKGSYDIIVGGRVIGSHFVEQNMGGEFQFDIAGNDASHMVMVCGQIDLEGGKDGVDRVYDGITRVAAQQNVPELAREAAQNYYLQREAPWLVKRLQELGGA